jgi:hypothetical protein
LGNPVSSTTPRHHWIAPQHRRNHKTQTPIQDGFVFPGGFGYERKRRLVHPSNMVAGEARGHRFDALPFARQQQGGAIVPQLKVTVGMGASTIPTEDGRAGRFIATTKRILSGILRAAREPRALIVKFWMRPNPLAQ